MGFQTEDATGRVVTQTDPVALHLMRPLTAAVLNRPDVIPAPLLRQIAEEADEGWGRRGHLIVLVYVFGLAATAAGIVFLEWRYATSVSGVVFCATITLWCVGAFVITWVIGKRARAKRVCLVMLEHRRCPHCAYDLRELPIEPGVGATVCPECGCAWRLDDPAAAEWLAADRRERAAAKVKNRKSVWFITALLVLGVVLAVAQWVRYTGAKRPVRPARNQPAMVQPALEP